MIRTISALLVGASMLASVPAHAADYVRYTITATGTRTTQNTIGSDPTTTTVREGALDFAFVLLASSIGAKSATSDPYSPYERVTGVTASATALDFNAQQSTDEARNFLMFTGAASLCGDFSAGIPGTNFAADSSCSSASYNTSGGRAGVYFSERFFGKVIAFQADRFSADDAREGLVSIDAVPEPASWAMMLVGFGLLGAALRIRSRYARIVSA